MKQFPFDSNSCPPFMVIEERQGKKSLFPHTEQLSKISWALQKEFRDGLPDRIARVDHRADDYNKLLLYTAAQSFCSVYHEARNDQIKLFALPDRNRVTRISIVQHIVEQQEEKLGLVHRFKFYAGDDFFTDVYLNGKRIAFASHTLDRFSLRVTDQIGTDLINLLEAFFGFPAVLMLCNHKPVLV